MSECWNESFMSRYAYMYLNMSMAGKSLFDSQMYRVHTLPIMSDYFIGTSCVHPSPPLPTLWPWPILLRWQSYGLGLFWCKGDECSLDPLLTTACPLRSPGPKMAAVVHLYGLHFFCFRQLTGSDSSVRSSFLLSLHTRYWQRRLRGYLLYTRYSPVQCFALFPCRSLSHNLHLTDRIHLFTN